MILNPLSKYILVLTHAKVHLFRRLGENLGRTLVEYYRLYPPCK